MVAQDACLYMNALERAEHLTSSADWQIVRNDSPWGEVPTEEVAFGENNAIGEDIVSGQGTAPLSCLQSCTLIGPALLYVFTISIRSVQAAIHFSAWVRNGVKVILYHADDLCFGLMIEVHDAPSSWKFLSGV